MTLAQRRAELERLGFQIVEETQETLVATTRRFHFDCMFTSVSYVVFVRHVPELTAELIEQDRLELQQRASSLDPSRLPRGFQKGTAVLTAYLADRVTPEARALCETKPKVRFAYFYLPAVLDRSTGLAHYLRTTPIWGALFFSKFRFLHESLLADTPTGGSWPVSGFGIFLTAFVIVVLLLNVALLLMR
jgi:hypothetical protein